MLLGLRMKDGAGLGLSWEKGPKRWVSHRVDRQPMLLGLSFYCFLSVNHLKEKTVVLGECPFLLFA